MGTDRIFIVASHPRYTIEGVPDTHETRLFEATLQCRYLLRGPLSKPSEPLAAVTLHGYGSHPRVMLELTAALLGPTWIIASLQGPYQHYVTNPAEGKAGYNWGIREHWKDAVELHHRMLLHVLTEVRDNFAASPRNCLLIAFSQAVGLNYRFCGTYPGETGGVIGICGGLPRDWDEDIYRTVAAPILHIARDEDEFYPVAVVTEFPGRLRIHANDVGFHLLPGKHRFPSKASLLVRPWLHRVFGPSA